MNQVALAEDDDLPPVEQFRSIALELEADRVVVGEEISTLQEQRF